MEAVVGDEVEAWVEAVVGAGVEVEAEAGVEAGVNWVWCRYFCYPLILRWIPHLQQKMKYSLHPQSLQRKTVSALTWRLRCHWTQNPGCRVSPAELLGSPAAPRLSG